MADVSKSTTVSSDGGDEMAQMTNLLNIMAQQRLQEQSLQHQADVNGTPYKPLPPQTNPIAGMAELLSVLQSAGQQQQQPAAGKSSQQPQYAGQNDATEALQSFAQPGRARSASASSGGEQKSIGDRLSGSVSKIEQGAIGKFDHLKNIFHSIAGLLGGGGGAG